MRICSIAPCISEACIAQLTLHDDNIIDDGAKAWIYTERDYTFIREVDRHDPQSYTVDAATATQFTQSAAGNTS